MDAAAPDSFFVICNGSLDLLLIETQIPAVQHKALQGGQFGKHGFYIICASGRQHTASRGKAGQAFSAQSYSVGLACCHQQHNSDPRCHQATDHAVHSLIPLPPYTLFDSNLSLAASCGHMSSSFQGMIRGMIRPPTDSNYRPSNDTCSAQPCSPSVHHVITVCEEYRILTCTCGPPSGQYGPPTCPSCA